MQTRESQCWFCLMRCTFRWFGIPMCHICRDQVYDFLWVSLVQFLAWMVGAIDGWFFVIDEILLFVVLVVVKHRVPTPWRR